MDEQIENTEKPQSTFLSRIAENAGHDKGYLITLRRAAGTMLNMANGDALMSFYKAYPSHEYEDKYFFVACIQCLWNPEDLKKAKPLAKAAAQFDSEAQKNFQKRMTAILDLTWEKDGYLATKLYRLIKFCKAKGVIVDCQDLLNDLIQWDYASRKVQKKWVRDFCGNITLDNKGGN